MNRKAFSPALVPDEFRFDVFSFENLIALGLPLAVLPGATNGQDHLIINLQHIRQYRIDEKGLICFQYQWDVENKWQTLSEDQSAALASKVQELSDFLQKQIKTGGH